MFAGGAAGALARTALADGWAPGTLPWATLVANVAGCLLLGAALVRTAPGTRARGLLAPGLCGGLTTFSTLQVELVELFRDGDTALALAYAALSLGLGVTAIGLGRRLAA